MVKTIKNYFCFSYAATSLLFALSLFVFFKPAHAHDWTNHHQTIHCSANVEQTSLFGYWRQISVTYTSANDSQTLITYRCIYSDESDTAWSQFDCNVVREQAGDQQFYGIKSRVRPFFYPRAATQRQACEDVYKEADLLLK
ncbi:hypothetical protein [Desulfonatronovibrio magnus]|uniref:hypothetical protein n=1 Tax=Desulfonatronovibrio magnus TaxID=698827 RepID=UPI0005EAD169|nr:hypothetical protein [Desulfonatronovibrio magnus]